jgi:hypothetical protein
LCGLLAGRGPVLGKFLATVNNKKHLEKNLKKDARQFCKKKKKKEVVGGMALLLEDLQK